MSKSQTIEDRLAALERAIAAKADQPNVDILEIRLASVEFAANDLNSRLMRAEADSQSVG
ncbi:hypothetical protein C7441_12174 [Pseudaminobacter salicylatoxidans]|uniref:Uncharacterized protein n=1 Tax=Pseudaminobacter salicylatoxidans TaxID=93369 RepID=A0A316BPZ3_PSESE|nr:hypothetical protein [Pseudaminobacter salicylatoxidans]PWJ75291.1 hypothetical protein C7441_12174 [Pseudaminobacter salicylatoxidans]